VCVVRVWRGWLGGVRGEVMEARGGGVGLVVLGVCGCCCIRGGVGEGEGVGGGDHRVSDSSRYPNPGGRSGGGESRMNDSSRYPSPRA
jgi:hypothetical protein